MSSAIRIDVQTGDFSPVPLGHGAIWLAAGLVPRRQGDILPSEITRPGVIVVRDLETGQEKELHSLADPSIMQSA